MASNLGRYPSDLPGQSCKHVAAHLNLGGNSNTPFFQRPTHGWQILFIFYFCFGLFFPVSLFGSGDGTRKGFSCTLHLYTVKLGLRPKVGCLLPIWKCVPIMIGTWLYFTGFKGCMLILGRKSSRPKPNWDAHISSTPVENIFPTLPTLAKRFLRHLPKSWVCPLETFCPHLPA